MSERKKDREENENQVCVLLSTCPQDASEKLAAFLVEKKYSACVNILPAVSSIYRWEGKITRDSECLLLVKCVRARVEEVTAAILKEHPYEVPEVIALDVKGGNPAYLSWVLESAGG